MKHVSEYLKGKGLGKLNPVQEEALSQGLLDGANIVVSSPTGSGKTLIAEIAALNTIRQGKKVIYTCPLRALATEQYNNFKSSHESTALSIGDFDSHDSQLGRYDWVCTTFEKLDSMLRKKEPWIKQCGLLIVDEIHEIDSDRGPTLEVMISRIKHFLPEVQILGLSATIPNTIEIAKWLNARVVSSDYRPVPLHEGTLLDNKIEFSNGDAGIYELKSDRKDPLSAVIEDTLKGDKQAIVFVNTKRSAESAALKLSMLTKVAIQERRTNAVASKILDALEIPTEQCKRLADLAKQGIAFHHSGLVNKQRQAIEDGFRNGVIKVIAATPTLAAGVNLPATRVVMNSMYYYTGAGSELIQVRNYKQRIGRAGRPQYDDFGEGIILAKDLSEKAMYTDMYINGQIEPVYSQLGNAAVLRTHVLSSIVAFTRDFESLKEFFSKTFYATQYGSIEQLESLLHEVITDLESWGFVKKQPSALVPTQLGIRVSDLYIDPFSAYKIIGALESDKRATDMSYLYLINDTIEMRPYLSVKRDQEGQLWSEAYERQDEFFHSITSWDFDDYSFLNKYRQSLMLQAWINEKTEQQLMEEFNVQPGILRSYLSNADWISYSAVELAKIVSKNRVTELQKMRKRLHDGIKEELFLLTEVKFIGRIRARRIYNDGLKTQADLMKVSYVDLAKLVGSKTAVKIKKDLGQDVSAFSSDSEIFENESVPQKSLADY